MVVVWLMSQRPQGGGVEVEQTPLTSMNMKFKEQEFEKIFENGMYFWHNQQCTSSNN